MISVLCAVVCLPLALLPGDDDGGYGKPVGSSELMGIGCHCAADFDMSGAVDGADLGRLLAAWGTPTCDITGNGTTDGADLGALLAVWGPCSVLPANDQCVNAITITEGVTQFCTFGATTDGPVFPPGSACIQFGYDSVNADIWYRYTAPASGQVTFSTCGTTWDTRLVAYGNALGTVAQCPTDGFSFTTIVACNDDFPGCGLGSQITFNVLAGNQYLVRVGGYTGYSGEGALSVHFVSTGQTCEDAIQIDSIGASGVERFVTDTTWDNDPATDVSPCGDGDTVPQWFKVAIQCPLLQAGTVTITTCHPETDFDTVLSVWKATSGGQCPGQFVACNDDSTAAGCQIGGLNRKSRVVFSSEISATTYYIRVSGYQGARGNFGLSVKLTCP
jgi:hypothetical protein